MTRKVNTERVTILHHPEENKSDHRTIQTTIPVNFSPNEVNRVIPISQRQNEDCISQANEKIPKELDKIEIELQLVNSAEKLEHVYRKFTNTMLQPWESIRTKERQGKIRSSNKKMIKSKQRRSTFYRNAKKSNKKEDWDKYEKADRQFRNIARKWKRKQHQIKRKKIDKSSGTELMKRVRSLLHNENTNQEYQGHQALNPKEFTNFMNTPASKGYIPKLEPFEIDDEFEQDIQKAIRRSPCGKAAGEDEIFVEAFRIDTERVARILSMLWKKCSEHKHIISAWNTAIMVPIYKKGRPDEPSSYRPIALLSHAKKVIEKAISYHLIKQTKFDRTQLGFTEYTGTENAIIRTTNHFSQKRNYVAVLDLKMAYNSVPRDKLIKEVRKRARRNVANMITFCLQPMNLITRGDNTNTTAIESRGVPQGSTLSPTLYNIFMDTYPEFLRRSHTEEMSTWSADLFADDVKLQANTAPKLQELLDSSSLWAKNMDMTWSPTKCSIIVPPNDTSKTQYTIANTTIKIVEEVEYLGVSINSTSLTATRNIGRVLNAQKMVHALRKVGINFKTLKPCTVRNIFNAFVYGTAQYAVHLIPRNKTLETEWTKLDEHAIRNILGIYSKRNDLKLRKIAEIPKLQQIKGLRLRCLEQRLESNASNNNNPNTEASKDDKKNLDRYRSERKLESNLERKQLYKSWNLLHRNHKRKLPELKVGRRIPAMRLLTGEYAANMARWYIGSFPINPRYLIQNEGEKAQSAMIDLRRLATLEEWNKDEENKMKEIIELLMKLQPDSWNAHTCNNDDARNKSKMKIGKETKRK